jgi:hypothetical protein
MPPTPELTLGAIYRVERAEVSEEWSDVGLWFVGVPAPGPWYGYSATRFRPIYRPNSTLIQSLLKPEKEDA